MADEKCLMSIQQAMVEQHWFPLQHLLVQQIRRHLVVSVGLLLAPLQSMIPEGVLEALPRLQGTELVWQHVAVACGAGAVASRAGRISEANAWSVCLQNAVTPPTLPCRMRVVKVVRPNVEMRERFQGASKICTRLITDECARVRGHMIADVEMTTVF